MNEPVYEATTGYSPAAAASADRAGRFSLLEEIGRGGMGAVYRAADPDLGRALAVKVLLGSLADQPALADRFLAEARLTARLQHPGVPPVHEMGTLPDGRPFFAMKLVLGRHLAEELAGRSSPGDDRSRFVGVFARICDAVAYAHSLNIIHRDLKPANVMVGAFGEVQVMDWGLAKEIGASEPPAGHAGTSEAETTRSGLTPSGSATQTGGVVGTPAYIAPEQARGEPVDARADVFGLGGVLCVILTGKPPFAAGGAEALRQAARGEVSEAHARLAASGADPELIDLARQCLAAEAKDRPADAGEVARRVEAYLAGVQERLRQAEQDRARAEVRAAEERKRRRLALLLAGAVLGLVTLGGVGAWAWQQQQQREAARKARAVENNTMLLDRNEALLRAGDWPAAKAQLDQVESLPETATRREEATWALALGARLDELRRERLLLLEGGALTGAMPHLYAEALAGHGLTLDDEASFERASRSPIRYAVLAVLDDWAVLEPDAGRREQVLARARALDPGAWQERFRDPALRGNRAALEKLADEADLDRLPTGSVVALAELLEQAAADPVPLLRRTRARHPSDFWLNFTLGTVLSRLEPAHQGEAVVMFEAARTLRPDSEQVWNNIGQALLGGVSVKRAEEELSRVIAARPDSIAAWGNLALARYQLGKVDEALDAVKRSIALMEKSGRRVEQSPYIWHTLGQIHDARGEPALALEAFRRGAEGGDRRPRVMANYARELRMAGRQEEARAVWRRVLAFADEAIRRRPSDAEAWVARGRAREQLGGRGEGIADLREAVRIAPSDANAWRNLSVSLQLAGDVHEALAAIDRCIALAREQGSERSPDMAYLWLERRLLLARRGRLEEALDAAREAVRIAPRSAYTWQRLVRSLNEIGDRAAARKAAEQGVRLAEEVLRQTPGHLDTLRQLGSLLRLLGRNAEAVALLRRLVADHPRDLDALLALAIALRTGGSRAALEESRSLLTLACRLQPRSAIAFYELSITCRVLGKSADAVAAAREAMRLSPDSMSARIVLANALLARGELDEGITLMRRTIAERPDYHFARQTLGHLLGAKGQLYDAIHEYRTAVRLAPAVRTMQVPLADARFRIGDWPGNLLALKQAESGGVVPPAARTTFNLQVAESRSQLALDDRLSKLLLLGKFPGPDRVSRAVAAYERMEAVLDGDARPRDFNEAVSLAYMAWMFAKRHGGAARLFEQAFALEPKLLDDGPDYLFRFHAGLAALGGAMHGTDTPPDPTDPLRGRMRQMAYRWLSEFVDRIAAEITAKGPTPTLEQRLKDLRDAEMVKEFREMSTQYYLTPAERRQWNRLFQRVDRLLAPPAMKRAN